MNYIELQIKLSEKEAHLGEILIAELAEIDFESFQENESEILAYIIENKFDKNEVERVLQPYLSAPDFVYRQIEQQNWNQVWEQNYFEPINIGRDCIVKAPFHQINADGYKHIITIQPKMAFGTGHHETTSQMLEWIMELDMTGKSVLDMGCGSGILAILASKEGAAQVLAIDYDEWSYQNTIENAEINQINNIEPVLGDAGYLNDQQFDVFIANINRNIILEDLHKYAKVLKPQGCMLLSGFYEADLEIIRAKAKLEKIKYIGKKSKNNWVAAKFIKQ